MGNPDAFIDYIFQRIKSDKGFRAEMRRANNPSVEWQAAGVLQHFLGDDFFVDDIRHAYALVASAAANSSLNKDGMYGFGLAMRRAADIKLSEKENKQFHPRFSRILASDGLRDLLEILRPTLQLIGAKSIPLDYSRLLSDLLRFRDGSKRDRVRIEWAADYLGHDVPDEEKEEK